jgi:hypothetical protein
VLLKNESDLNEEQKAKFVQVKDVSFTLKNMHESKKIIRRSFPHANNWLVVC